MSATGGPSIDRRRAGMTLIEMLVTLGIVAVVTGMVVMGLGIGSRGADPKTEVNRLADRLGLAVDEALVTRRSIALSWDASGYGFVTRSADGRWIQDPQPQLGPRHTLPKGLTMSGEAPVLLPIGADITTTPARFSVAGPRAAWDLAFDGLNTTAFPTDGA